MFINFVVSIIIMACIIQLAKRNYTPELKTRTFNNLDIYNPKPLMTPTEFKFLSLLENACPEFRFHTQVCMGAILEPSVSKSNMRLFHTSRDRISRKIIDFVAQDRVSGNIVALIELDDYTHIQSKDDQRDAYTKSAGFKTIRWNVVNQPDVMTIRKILLQSSVNTSTVPNITTSIVPPLKKSALPNWLLSLCLFLCAVYLTYPHYTKTLTYPTPQRNVLNLKIENKTPLVRQNKVQSDSIESIKNKLITVLKLTEQDIKTSHVNIDVKNVTLLDQKIENYKLQLNLIDVPECLRLPHTQIITGLKAYQTASDVLRTKSRIIPPEFNQYITTSQYSKLEDNTDIELRLKLKAATSNGHISEPPYVAYQLIQFGSGILAHAKDTMQMCP